MAIVLYKPGIQILQSRHIFDPKYVLERPFQYQNQFQPGSYEWGKEIILSSYLIVSGHWVFPSVSFLFWFSFPLYILWRNLLDVYWYRLLIFSFFLYWDCFYIGPKANIHEIKISLRWNNPEERCLVNPDICGWVTFGLSSLKLGLPTNVWCLFIAFVPHKLYDLLRIKEQINKS